MKPATKVTFTCSKCGLDKKGPRIAREGKLICHSCYQAETNS